MSAEPWETRKQSRLAPYRRNLNRGHTGWIYVDILSTSIKKRKVSPRLFMQVEAGGKKARRAPLI